MEFSSDEATRRRSYKKLQEEGKEGNHKGKLIS